MLTLCLSYIFSNKLSFNKKQLKGFLLRHNANLIFHRLQYCVSITFMCTRNPKIPKTSFATMSSLLCSGTKIGNIPMVCLCKNVWPSPRSCQIIFHVSHLQGNLPGPPLGSNPWSQSWMPLLSSWDVLYFSPNIACLDQWGPFWEIINFS